jgi:adenosylhomocysteine nucleosidase
MEGLTVVCGMSSEVKIAKEFFDAKVVQHDSNVELDSVVAGCRFIASFGICGGLSRGFEIGDILVAYRVTTGHSDLGGFATYAAWNDAILKRFGTHDRLSVRCKPANWYSDGTIDADTVEQRRALHDRTKANAVDDETYYVANYAHKHSIPWVCVRTVCDDWETNLPPAARGDILHANGDVNNWYLAKSLMYNPLQAVALLRTGLDYDRALGSLRVAAKILGKDFGTPEWYWNSSNSTAKAA